MKKFSTGEIVGIRYQTSGTFGGWESDWRAGVYQGMHGDSHLVAVFPQMKDMGFSVDAVADEDIRPAGDLWGWLEGTRLARDVAMRKNFASGEKSS